jgi:hypothetical protein
LPKAGVSLIPELPAEIIAALTPSKHAAINSAQDCIKWLNEMALKLPARYGWRFRTVEAFNAEAAQLRRGDVGGLNRLYWQDAIKNCEAYSVMSTWRLMELARSCVWALARRDLLCAALMARSALESTTHYLDSSRTVAATLEQIGDVDFRKVVVISEDLEEFLLKTVFASKRADDEEIYKPTNILTIITRIAKSPDQENISSFYETLCEVAHPNFLGRTVHVLEVRPGPREGDEIRILGPGQNMSFTSITEATVGALSWACGTHVTSFAAMSTAIGGFLTRLNSGRAQTK